MSKLKQIVCPLVAALLMLAVSGCKTQAPLLAAPVGEPVGGSAGAAPGKIEVSPDSSRDIRPVEAAATYPPPVAVPGTSLYPLWYATNRQPLVRNKVLLSYSGEPASGKTHYGKVYVEIPRDYLQAHSAISLYKILFRSDESRLKVLNPAPLTEKVFMDQLRHEISSSRSDKRTVLIYIHGFRTSFEEAAQRAASIGYQLKIPVTAMYSWPSKGRVKSYLADRDAAALSEDDIANFIVEVRERSGADKVHIIAHSMGNYALLRAMHRRKMQEAIRKGLRLGQIILAAPDVDTALFKRDASVFAPVSDRVTMYVSKSDKALMASKSLAERGRAGLTPPVLVLPGIDTVDVSSVNLTLLGHSFVEAELAVLRDMGALIRYDEPPHERIYLEKHGDHWLLQ